MLANYFAGLYRRTMTLAYDRAFDEIEAGARGNGLVLDCGAGNGHSFDRMKNTFQLDAARYRGIEWSHSLVSLATAKGLAVTQGDLNSRLGFESNSVQCIFGLSVLEHLLNGCAFLKETHRVLEPSGTLVILTPNISTLFSIALLLVGKMPSTGPHPDSTSLLNKQTIYEVSTNHSNADIESDTPQHRHLVVFSYRVLRQYLEMIGFRDIKGWGFGLYPFPNISQPLLEKLDPYHCHQMVFSCRK